MANATVDNATVTQSNSGLLPEQAKFIQGGDVRALAVDSGTYVYSGGYDNTLKQLSYDLSTENWSFSKTSPFLSAELDPNNNNVYTGTDGNTIYKVDTTGTEQWSVSLSGSVYEIAVNQNTGDLYGVTKSQTTEAFDSAGNSLWSDGNWSNRVHSVTVDENTGNVYAVSSGKIQAYDSSGSILWSQGVSGDTILTLDNNRDLIHNDGGTLYKRSISDGSVIWSYASGGQSASVGPNNNIYFSDGNGELEKVSTVGDNIWGPVSVSANSTRSCVFDSKNIFAGSDGDIVRKVSEGHPLTNNVKQKLYFNSDSGLLLDGSFTSGAYNSDTIIVDGTERIGADGSWSYTGFDIS